MATSELVDLGDLRDAIATAEAVSPVGGRTHWEVGGPPPTPALEVRAPAGIVTYDPADLTVTVAAGTTCAELAAVLADAGQECALDPRAGESTIGGLLATGLSGHRRLRYGPLRDRVLEVRFVTGDGRMVKAGGPTVKNVSGYDLPRLLVGSLGTIGVITQVTLRCQPQVTVASWRRTEADPFDLRRRTFRPSCIAWDGRVTHVLLEGDATDVEAEGQTVGGEPAPAPEWPVGPHRGRISVRPSVVAAIAAALDQTAVRWQAEVGVGTIHVAATNEADLAAARLAAERAAGWMLREAGAPGLDPFGVDLPNRALMERVRAAFDPDAKLAPGRLPLTAGRAVSPSGGR